MNLKSLSISIFLLLFSLNLLAQQASQMLPFKIEGFINADTGTVKLEVLFDKDYYPKGVESMIARVENGKFTFDGSIPYPQGFTISYEDEYYSDLFVIEPGIQKVSCDVHSSGEVPKVENDVMREFHEEYDQAFQPVTQKIKALYARRDSISHLPHEKVSDDIRVAIEQEFKGYYAEIDSIRLAYISSHPDSYVALWRFIKLFSSFGYESIYDATYAQFSDSIKNTHTGKVLARKLEVAGILASGKPFPAINAVDIQNNKIDNTSFANNQFTLIDFWYSNCPPCIAQFPHLKEIYERYKDNGFEIVAISTDKQKYKQNWQKVIKKHQLTWPQYWDQDGIETTKLSINKFPTNFLLDSEGNIIHKDLRPIELEDFLKKNLNN